MNVAVRRYIGAAPLVDTLIQREHEIRALLSRVTGFQSYCAIRAGPGAVTIITVCDSEAGADEASQRTAAWIEANVPEAVTSPLGS